MKPFDRRYVVGIDLGTTNSAVSYAALEEGNREGGASGIEVFHMPQLVHEGEVSALPVLPSFLYLCAGYEVQPESLALPWKKETDETVGTLAREQGSRVPGRLVSSAKSWLCHGKVDRTGRILPWGADKDVKKVSPVQATAAYLRHIREAWNHGWNGEEDHILENQNVIVTVPASFDEVARDLTLEASRLAGLPDVTLLEEPLAAFYSWLVFHEKDWQSHVRPGQLICVCDVGGGTSDFTLITLREVEASPRFERIAVGDHLILGGDNMDLALARGAESRLRDGGSQSLSANRWQALCHQCRQAKELILEGGADSKTVTLMGEGRRLIAGTLAVTLDRSEVERVILEGFFPIVDRTGSPAEGVRKGITEFGLPYAQDPAVTRHLCRFLERHAQDVQRVLGRSGPFPDFLLFNGGALKPEKVQARILQAIRHWFGEEAQPAVLHNPNLDLAVSRGAAYYGLVKAGRGVRVGSGSARAYYLGVSREGDAGGPKGEEAAICLVERGMEEGTQIELAEREFQVLANRPVSFRMYSSSYRSGDRMGDLVSVDDSLTLMAPLHTVIQFGKKAGQKSVPVRVEARYTEMGTLALWCHSIATGHRWRLQFQLRSVDSGPTVGDDQVFEESTVQEARDLVAGVFAGEDRTVSPEALVGAVAKVVQRPRDRWPLGFIRRLADDLLDRAPARKKSPDHEARWLNLTGFCLRPGCGDAVDPHRIRNVWTHFQKGPVYGNHSQVTLEWWVLWRRVAGGLSAGQQRQILQDLAATVRPRRGMPQTKMSAQESMEIWMLLGNLERLTAKDKTELGSSLLTQLHPRKSKPQQWWALSRLGARDLLYGPLDRVVAPEDVTRWIETVLGIEWRNPRPVGQALAQMARCTGDRRRDVAQSVREKVVQWLQPHDWSVPCVLLVTEVIPIDAQEESMLFGESLPSGIVLRE